MEEQDATLPHRPVTKEKIRRNHMGLSLGKHRDSPIVRHNATTAVDGDVLQQRSVARDNDRRRGCAEKRMA